MFKKILSLLLVLALTLGALTCLGSCNKKDDDKDNNSGGTNTGDSTDSDTDGKVTYTVTVLNGTEPVKGAKLLLIPTSGAKQPKTTGADGKASWTVDAGSYKVQLASATGFTLSADQKAERDFGADNSLTIDLSEGGSEEVSGYTYTVYLVDDSGAPISGVTLQICDQMCRPGVTDADGKVVFKGVDTANYKAQLTSAVDGYATPAGGWDEKYPFTDFVVTITLTRAN